MIATSVLLGSRCGSRHCARSRGLHRPVPGAVVGPTQRSKLLGRVDAGSANLLAPRTASGPPRPRRFLRALPWPGGFRPGFVGVSGLRGLASVTKAQRPPGRVAKGLAPMPEVGVEPTRPEGHGILSPARLPVPPLRRRSAIVAAVRQPKNARATSYQCAGTVFSSRVASSSATSTISSPWRAAMRPKFR